MELKSQTSRVSKNFKNVNKLEIINKKDRETRALQKKNMLKTMEKFGSFRVKKPT